jgi:hypothetical protein
MVVSNRKTTSLKHDYNVTAFRNIHAITINSQTIKIKPMGKRHAGKAMLVL